MKRLAKDTISKHLLQKVIHKMLLFFDNNMRIILILLVVLGQTIPHLPYFFIIGILVFAIINTNIGA